VYDASTAFGGRILNLKPKENYKEMTNETSQTVPPQAKAHEFKIFVNTREKLVTTDMLTYEQVVALAFDPVPSGDGVRITVLYHHANQHPADGSLLPTKSVKIKNNTSFDVTPTNRS
jgi:Multiubiquitin